MLMPITLPFTTLWKDHKCISRHSSFKTDYIFQLSLVATILHTSMIKWCSKDFDTTTSIPSTSLSLIRYIDNPIFTRSHEYRSLTSCSTSTHNCNMETCKWEDSITPMVVFITNQNAMLRFSMKLTNLHVACSIYHPMSYWSSKPSNILRTIIRKPWSHASKYDHGYASMRYD